MQTTIEGLLFSIRKDPDFTVKESGEVIEGKSKLELLVENELSNGSIKHEMLNISIPKEKLPDYESQVGKKVQVLCNFMSKSPVIFYVK